MEKFTIGTPVRQVITARNMNEIADAVNRVHSLADDPRSAFNAPAQNSIVRVYSYSAFPKFAAVSLTSTLISDPVNCADPIPTLVAAAASDNAPLAILQEPVNSGEYARALVSGVSFARIVINDPSHIYAKPKASVPGILESAASGPVRILAVSSRELDGYPVAAVLLGASGSGSSSFSYSGPLSLHLGDSGISMTPGIIWTPDGSIWADPDSITKPADSSFIILSSSALSAMTDDGFLEDFIRQNPHYWDSHAILGRYDAETDTIEQYHFSPIVHFIETEDFVIEPV